jgi:flagellar biosynthesis protein FlhA
MGFAENGFFRGILHDSTDIVMVLAVIGILMAMILPLPPVVLDLSLSLNITVSIICTR